MFTEQNRRLQNRTEPEGPCLLYQGESAQTREVEQSRLTRSQRPGWAGTWLSPTAFALFKAPPGRDGSFQGPFWREEGCQEGSQNKKNTTSIGAWEKYGTLIL